MKKLEMGYGPFICTIIFSLILGIRFRKELLMFSLRLELLTFARYFLVTGVYNTGISFSCWRLLLIYCMLSFVSTTFSTQPQPLFVFLQYEAGSNNKRDKTKSCKHQSHERV